MDGGNYGQCASIRAPPAPGTGSLSGLVNYDTGQPWGEAHMAGWAAEPPRPSTLQLVFTLGLLWGTLCPRWGTHERQAPLVGLGV